MNKPELGVEVFPYSKELIEKMANNSINGVPSCFFFLDSRKTVTQCHLFSDLLTYLIDNSNRVTGTVNAKVRAH